MFQRHTFQVLTDLAPTRNWDGALSRFFQICRELMTSLNADIRAGRLPERSCVRGALEDSHSLDKNLLSGLQSLKDDYPIELTAPFEGVASISGGVWKASDLFAESSVDAVLKLRFNAGTTDLPMHSHEYSDRVIVVVDGSGVFDVSPDAKSGFSEARIRSTPVCTGDVLAFSRGVLHTFKTHAGDLLLLSYHSPFISLDDPRQYSLPEC